MININVTKLGTAVAFTFAMLYLFCMILTLFGSETYIVLSNSLFHGMDIRPIARTNVPLKDTLFGLVLLTLIGYFIGATVALVYNYQIRRYPEVSHKD